MDKVNAIGTMYYQLPSLEIRMYKSFFIFMWKTTIRDWHTDFARFKKVGNTNLNFFIINISFFVDL